ncbi:MAG: hypothetical protein NT124_01795 [Candidatus Dependentiae bacterium]|nr:hypothetical protein [Candidatus Dependentiae bacterium]
MSKQKVGLLGVFVFVLGGFQGDLSAAAEKKMSASEKRLAGVKKMKAEAAEAVRAKGGAAAEEQRPGISGRLVEPRAAGRGKTKDVGGVPVAPLAPAAPAWAGAARPAYNPIMSEREQLDAAIAESILLEQERLEEERKLQQERRPRAEGLLGERAAARDVPDSARSVVVPSAPPAPPEDVALREALVASSESERQRQQLQQERESAEEEARLRAAIALSLEANEPVDRARRARLTEAAQGSREEKEEAAESQAINAQRLKRVNQLIARLFKLPFMKESRWNRSFRSLLENVRNEDPIKEGVLVNILTILEGPDDYKDDKNGQLRTIFAKDIRASSRWGSEFTWDQYNQDFQSAVKNFIARYGKELNFLSIPESRR